MTASPAAQYVNLNGHQPRVLGTLEYKQATRTRWTYYSMYHPRRPAPFAVTHLAQ